MLRPYSAGIAGITKTNYLSELTVHSDLTCKLLNNGVFLVAAAY